MDTKRMTSEYLTDEEIELAQQGLCIWQTEYGCRMGYIGYCKTPADQDEATVVRTLTLLVLEAPDAAAALASQLAIGAARIGGDSC